LPNFHPADVHAYSVANHDFLLCDIDILDAKMQYHIILDMPGAQPKYFEFAVYNFEII